MLDIENINSSIEELRKEISSIIVGQKKVVDYLIISLLSQGHILLTGVPGLAKTLLVNTFSRAVNLDFRRIQFTPDLMPSDILGSEIIDVDKVNNEKKFRFIKGPIFGNIILADEINRTPPRTQSALLEAMQERSVHIAGQKHELINPFMVVATQNPLEQQGTYPLPEAQLDRFMFAVDIEYPSEEEEFFIIANSNDRKLDKINHIWTRNDILKFQEIIKKVPLNDKLINYIIKIVRLTRPTKENKISEIKEYINWGAGPRAGEFLARACKAIAVIKGKTMPDYSDVNDVLYQVLNHRIALNFNAGVDKINKKDIIKILIKNIG